MACFSPTCTDLLVLGEPLPRFSPPHGDSAWAPPYSEGCLPCSRKELAASSHSSTPSAPQGQLKRVRSCRDSGGAIERAYTEGDAPHTPIKLRRGASYREGGSHSPLDRAPSSAGSVSSIAHLDRASSGGEGRCSRSSESSASPLPSPTSHTPHSTHRSLPQFKAMSEADARLVFRSLVEAVHRSRISTEDGEASSDTSILFGACNEPCCRPVTFFAPEMVERDGEGVCDLDHLEIWSLGVLLYQMLTGKQPFEGRTDAKTLRLILACKVRFPLFSWQSLSLSQEVKGLIRSMLAFRPGDRPTIGQVLKHPWLCQSPKRH